MDTYLAFNATYLVSTAIYCCKLSFNVFLMEQDHGDISLAGVMNGLSVPREVPN